MSAARLYSVACVAMSLLATSLVVALSAGAGAAPDGSGELRGGRLDVGIEAHHDGRSTVGTETGGDGPVVPIDAGSSSLPPLVHYRSMPLPGGRAGDIGGNLCNAGRPPDAVFGWLYDVVGYSNDGTVVSDTHVCVAFPDQGDQSAPPPPPVMPTSPTAGDVWRAVALPRPVVGVDPVTRGVTELDTWLWSGGPQTAQVAVTLGGFRVAGIARVVEYRFFTDEGYVGASPTPGDASHPAAMHRFATKGAHLLAVAAVWRATVTMIGPGGGAAAVPIDIDVAVLTATVDYPVVEVRSRLVG